MIREKDIHRLWEKAGIVTYKEHETLQSYGGRRIGTVKVPYYNGSICLPTIDLNNLFRWLVDKAIAKLTITYSLTTSNARRKLFDLWQEELESGDYERDWRHTMTKEAATLAQAIYKVMKAK